MKLPKMMADRNEKLDICSGAHEGLGGRERGRAGDGSKDRGLQDRESMAALHGPWLRDEAGLTEHGQGPREPLDAPTDLGTEVRMCVGRVERQQENGEKWPLWREF